MSKVHFMADQPNNWIDAVFSGFNPGVGALALAGLTGCGKLVYDFAQILFDGYKNKSKAELDAEIQESKNKIDGHGLAIKVLQDGLAEANARAALALKQNIECEAKHELLISKYNDIILTFAMKGEKLENAANKLEKRTQNLEDINTEEDLLK